MKGKRHSAEQIISKLREAEVLLQKGQAVPQVCRQLGVTAQTYYRWRKEYGGMRMDQAKRLKDLEKENTRLKKIVADQALDMAILKDVASGKFRARENAEAPFRGPVRVTECQSVAPVGCLGRLVPPSAITNESGRMRRLYERSPSNWPRTTGATESPGSWISCARGESW